MANEWISNDVLTEFDTRSLAVGSLSHGYKTLHSNGRIGK